MSDDVPVKIVPFKIVTNTTPKTEPDQAQVSAEEVNVTHSCISELSTFLADNKNVIRYFVTGVALGEGEDVAFHIFTSPMSVPDFAMTVALFQNSLQNKINQGDY